MDEQEANEYNINQAEIANWRKRVSDCNDPSTLKYLMQNKPKGAKTIVSGVVMGGVPSGGNLPLLNELRKG